MASTNNTPVKCAPLIVSKTPEGKRSLSVGYRQDPENSCNLVKKIRTPKMDTVMSNTDQGQGQSGDPCTQLGNPQAQSATSQLTGPVPQISDMDIQLINPLPCPTNSQSLAVPSTTSTSKTMQGQTNMVCNQDSLSKVADSVKTAANCLIDASMVQLQIIKRRIAVSNDIDNDIKIWKEFEESSTIKAVAELCIQGLSLFASHANSTPLHQPISYSKVVSESQPQVSLNNPTTDEIHEATQLQMIPKASLDKTTDKYFWDAIYGKGAQVSSISYKGIVLTITTVDHENAQMTYDLLCAAKAGDRKLTDLFSINIIARPKYFIKTQRITRQVLNSTTILKGDAIDTNALADELVKGNPSWFKDRNSFEILEAKHVDMHEKLPAGYIITLAVERDTFKKYLSKRRQNLIIERVIVPSYPSMRPDLCFRCLNFGHSTETCSRRTVCRKCGNKHNYPHRKCNAEKNCINCNEHNNIVAQQGKGIVYPTQHLATSNSCKATMDRINYLVDEIRSEGHD